MLVSKPIDGMALPHDRYGTGFGKPKFPTAITDTTRLGDLVSADSWYIVELKEMDMDFLNDDVENCPGHPSFLSSKGKMNSLNAANDSTGRGMELSADFLDTAKTEKNYQNILQAVEDHKKKALSLRSKKETTSTHQQVYISRN